jgi:hypothetical protein
VGRQVPSVVLGARDAQGRDVADARALVDGEPVRDRLDGNPVPLDPGSHVVRFERPGAAPVEVTIVLRAGEKDRPVLATFAPPPGAAAPGTPAATGSPATGSAAPGAGVAPSSAPGAGAPTPAADAGAERGRHVPAGAWILGGLGIVAIGAFGYLGWQGKTDADHLRSTCAPGCDPSQVTHVRTELVAADVSLGVGVVSLGAALWIAVAGLSRPAHAAAWNVVVEPSRSGAQGGVKVLF